MRMTDCCDGSTQLDYMGNLVMDIRLETWSMAVLCRDIMQEHLYRCHLWDPMRSAKVGMLCMWICWCDMEMFYL